MITAVIVDDEQHCIDRLSQLIESNHRSVIHLAGTFTSVQEGIAGILMLKPQLVFLDIQIHDQTGFDLLQMIGEVDFEVIFTTAYDHFAVRAFKFSALDYLLKPIDHEELNQAIARFQSAGNKNQAVNNKLDVLLNHLQPLSSSNKKIVIPTSSGLEIIDVADIIRCESDINYTTLYFRNAQKLVVAKTLKEFEEMLEEYGFFRIHNSHLVNLSFVKRYYKGKGGSIILNDGTELEVSTRKKEDFLKALSKI